MRAASSDCRRDGYARRRPEETLLYQIVQAHFPAVRERAEEHGGLPKFVTREFEEYLRCGILSEGCLHLVCRACGHEHVVGLSCKRRGFCPSCLGRRMADSAVHLERSVLPAVAVRHWICSLPWGLRALLGYDRVLAANVANAFATELSRSLKKKAKAALKLRSVSDAHTGSVLAVQRTDSALRLNVHFHVLALDGVYVRDKASDGLVFQPLGTPTRAEVANIAARTAARIEKILKKAGRSLDAEMPEQPPELCDKEPGLAACYGAAAQGGCVSGDRAGLPPLRLIATGDPKLPTDDPSDPVAEVRGVNLHARQVVDGRDRRRLERLARYICRPPIAQERLTLRPDGTLELELKSTWKDGTRAFVFCPEDLVLRLVAAIPPPRWHMLRYFGILSSHCRLRKEVVPRPAADPTAFGPPPAAGDQLELRFEDLSDGEPPRRNRWAWLLAHVFRVDVETCERCGGPMRWVDVATTRRSAARLLAELGLGPQPPPEPKPIAFGQLALPFRK